MELPELKAKLENSSLMDAINGHVLSFIEITEKNGVLSGKATLEDESGSLEDKEAAFELYKAGDAYILKTTLFANKQQEYNLIIKKYSIDFSLAQNPDPEYDFNYIINTN